MNINDIVNKIPDKKISISINVLGLIEKIIKKIQIKRNKKD